MSTEDPGLYIVLKFTKGALDTKAGRNSYQYKPAARIYPTKAPASQMRTRWTKQGYDVRIGRLTIDETGQPQIEYVDQDMPPVVDRCKHRKSGYDGSGRWRQNICMRRKGHPGIHWAGVEAKRDPDFDPETAATA